MHCCRIIPMFLVFLRLFYREDKIWFRFQKSFGDHWFQEGHFTMIKSIDKCCSKFPPGELRCSGINPMSTHVRNRYSSTHIILWNILLWNGYSIGTGNNSSLFLLADLVKMKIKVGNSISKERIMSIRIPVHFAMIKSEQLALRMELKHKTVFGILGWQIFQSRSIEQNPDRLRLRSFHFNKCTCLSVTNFYRRSQESLNIVVVLFAGSKS